MRINIPLAVLDRDKFNTAVDVMTGPLILSRDPEESLEAATKQYVDSSLSSIDASSIVGGVLDVARLGEFGGDLRNEDGQIVFSKTGVSTGRYNKVTVNAKGRVVSGGALVSGDIPELSWGKLGSGKPTTLAGFGITGALSKAGGQLIGSLTSTFNPYKPMEIVTKKQSEEIVDSYRVVVGDVVRKPLDVTPEGFLKCNGGLVSKEIYANLYAVIGDRFNIGTLPGAGKPWKNQYGINTVGDSLGAWTTATSLPGPLGQSQAIVTSSRVYLLGGFIGGSYVSTVYTAPINEDGTLGAWTTDTNSLPGTSSGSQAVVTSNRVYLLGGNSSRVYTAPINEDGTLGTWTTGTSLPGVSSGSQAVVTSNRVYLLGGNSSRVYTAPINGDGTLGTWTTDTSLPVALSNFQAIVTSNRVYLLGGGNNSGYVSTVYTAPINGDGTLGAWTTASSLPSTLGLSQAIVTSNRVYLLGGLIGGSYVSTVYTAPINEDGTLGAWTTDTNSLPGDLSLSQAIVTSNRVYLLGGRVGSSYVSTVYTATFSGGKNDYSKYYDGSIPAFYGPNKFQLPNIKFNNQPKVNAFIKY